MRHAGAVLTGLILTFLAAVALGQGDQSTAVQRAAAPAGGKGDALRIGLAPEQDVFHLRRSYRELADYLAGKLGKPVELVTVRSYQSVLREFDEEHIDAAFVGSLVAVLTTDRFSAKVLVRPEMPAEVHGCRGVLFVKSDSPIKGVADIRGHSIGILPGTYAGCLFPLSEMSRLGILKADAPPRIVRMGTYDEVIEAVASGRVEVGAAKDLLLDTYEAANPKTKLRRLLTSDHIPHNALVARPDAPGLDKLVEALRTMHEDATGRKALAALGAARFVPCENDEYAPVYRAIEALGDAWTMVGLTEPAPRRRAMQTQPAATQAADRLAAPVPAP